MEFGVFDHLDRRDEPLSKLYSDRLKMVAAIEEAGFYSYHVAEHHATPLGMAPSPNLLLAAVATHTKTLRFGPMVYLLPLYHPVRLIEEIAMLDQMSEGRLDVGVGRGVSRFEISGYGIDPEKSREMFEEFLDVLLKGLTSERLDHHGKWYNVPDVPMEIRPVQQPYPPLWYGAANEDGARFSARWGMHCVTLGGNERVKGLIAQYDQIWKETAGEPARANSPVKTPLIGLGRHIFVADTDEEAELYAGPAYIHWFNSLAKLWRDHGAAPVTGMIIDTYEEARDLGQVVAGTPDTVKAKLAAQAEDIGFNYLVCQFAWGDLGHEREMRSFDLFTKEVMPDLAKL